MNTRKLINRNVTYSIVTVKFKDGFWNDEYYVYGTTSIKSELKKILKNDNCPVDDIPVVTIKQVTEKRSMTIDDFIKYSIKVN